MTRRPARYFDEAKPSESGSDITDTHLRIVSRVTEPDFLDLPWDQPLFGWTHPRTATVTRGISCHTVRFVRYGERIFALKETEDRPADIENRMLTLLHDDFGLRTVRPVAVIKG